MADLREELEDVDEGERQVGELREPEEERAVVVREREAPRAAAEHRSTAVPAWCASIIGAQSPPPMYSEARNAYSEYASMTCCGARAVEREREHARRAGDPRPRGRESLE